MLAALHWLTEKNVAGDSSPATQRRILLTSFAGKASRLTLLTDSILADVMAAVTSSTRSGGIPRLSSSRVDLQQLLPIQRHAPKSSESERRPAGRCVLF